MDLMDLGDIGSGCDDENCGLAPGFLEDCTNAECQWEDEPWFGLIELVCVTVIYIPLMLFGLLGNVLTILVVWLRPHMRSSSYLYLSSMAVSDLLILLLLPLDLYKLWRPRPWPLGDLACKLTMFLSECCTFCTILHITFLSLERYLAVCWPITAKTLVTRHRTRVLIGCLWLVAAVSAAPVLVMVGVEEVGGEEVGFGGWREDDGWTGREGEQRAFIISGGERENGQLALEGIKWEEKEGERAEELKEEKHSRQTYERKQKDEMKDEVQMKAGEEEEGEGKMEEQQNKMKEDEGGGREESVDERHRTVIDKRECRCTHYAVSSGLLSAMMILSNLYFLVPFCILGLVYSLIGRTLWLRPQNSRRDQNHRHTVKMLGVIVLAFVLCWLPFHVGRTIFFSLSQETGTDRQETYMDTNPHLGANALSDVTVDTVTKPIDHSNYAHTHADEDTHSSDAKTEMHTDASKHAYSHVVSRTRGQRKHTETDTYPPTHTETQNDPEQLDRFTDTKNNTMHSTQTNTGNGTHEDSHIETQIYAPDSFHPDSTHTNRTHSHTLTNRQNSHSKTTHSQTPSTTRIHTFPPTLTSLFTDNTHNNTLFNTTHLHGDSHLYFLYYLSQYFNLVSSVLFYLSAAVNPLLYNLMSARYRHAVYSLIHTTSHAQSHRLRSFAVQHSTTTL